MIEDFLRINLKIVLKLLNNNTFLLNKLFRIDFVAVNSYSIVIGPSAGCNEMQPVNLFGFIASVRELLSLRIAYMPDRQRLRSVSMRSTKESYCFPDSAQVPDRR